MTQSEKLKNARNLLLKLHKVLVDYERASFTKFYGHVTATQFLAQLLENPDLGWLRRFSTLIVDIDEMFAQKDGYDADSVSVHIAAMRNLVEMDDLSPEFRSRYQLALQGDVDAAALHAELKQSLNN